LQITRITRILEIEVNGTERGRRYSIVHIRDVFLSGPHEGSEEKG